MLPKESDMEDKTSCRKCKDSGYRRDDQVDKQGLSIIYQSILFFSFSLATFSFVHSIYLSSQIEELKKHSVPSRESNDEVTVLEMEDLKTDKDVIFGENIRHKRAISSGQPRILLDSFQVNGFTASTLHSATSISQNQPNLFDVTAAHFVARGMQDSELIRQFQGNSAHCISIWEGHFCRNNTFWTTAVNHAVKFLSISDWMKQHQQQSAPLIKDVSGQLRTVKDGLYLLYLNVLIQATKIAHDIGIFIDNQRKLDCRETLDYIRPSANGNPFQFARGKTCSISGVFYLNSNQVISIKLVTPNTVVVLRPENTNFGAVCLSQV